MATNKKITIGCHGLLLLASTPTYLAACTDNGTPAAKTIINPTKEKKATIKPFLYPLNAATRATIRTMMSIIMSINFCYVFTKLRQLVVIKEHITKDTF